FFQAEDGIRDYKVTGVQTCALPICPTCARLLTGKPEIPDLYGVRGIAEVIDLRHAARAPVGRARDQKGNAGLALPPALVGIFQRSEERRVGKECRSRCARHS